MAEFAKLVEEAPQALAEKGTDIQRKRFAVFLAGTWSYMQAGRAEYERLTAAPIPSVRGFRAWRGRRRSSQSGLDKGRVAFRAVV